jgi:NADH dehydrogenase
MSHPGATATGRHKVVIIGSGFGGLNAAKALKRADVDIKMIARTTHHLFQPLLYQVATGIISSGEIAPPTRIILRKQKNVQVLLGNVTHIDLANKTVKSELLGHSYVTPYDSLIIAAGAGQSYFGNDHFAEWAPGMKTVDDALELRGRILGAFEQAERSSDPARREKLLTFTVVGAGPTGVEMAGQIAELADHTLKGAFRHIDSTQAKVILLDAAPAVLPPMGEKLGKKAQARLEKMGVDIQLGAMVTDVDRNGITVKDSDGTIRRIESATKVWSAGVSASPLGRDLAEQSDVELDRAGRVKVLPDLSLPGHRNVFVVGDMAAVEGVPGMAQGAIQGAKYAAKAIKAELRGADPARAVPVLRQGLDGDGVALLGGGQGRTDRIRRLHRLAGMAGAALGVPRRVQDQDHHAPVVDGDVPVDGTRQPDHYRAAGVRPHQDRGTAGDRGLGQGHRKSGELKFRRGRSAGGTAPPEG